MKYTPWELFESSCRKFENKTMVVFNGKEYSYAQMREKVCEFANLLNQWDFRNGRVQNVVWSLHRTRDASRADKAMKSVADKYYVIAMEKGKVKVGKSEVKLDGIRSHVRSQEATLGDLLADAMREAGNADIALMNGGGIRESIPDGDIDLYKVGKALPFINSLVTVEMKGRNIYSALERGIRQYPNSGTNGGFLQVSGIKFTFDASRPAGERVTKVIYNGGELDKDKLYSVATNDYLYNDEAFC